MPIDGSPMRYLHGHIGQRIGILCVRLLNIRLDDTILDVEVLRLSMSGVPTPTTFFARAFYFAFYVPYR